MLSNNPAEPLPQAAPQRDAKAAAAGASVPVLDPRSPIEVASGPNPPPPDPGGVDKPPGVIDPDLYA